MFQFSVGQLQLKSITGVEFRTFQAEIKSQQGVISGDVRIGLVPSLAQAVSASLFRTTQELYPAVRLILMEGVTAQLDAWRSNDEVDITILFRAGQSELRGEDSLGSVDTYLVGARGDNLTAGAAVRFSELSGLPLVLAPAPNALRADVERQAQPRQQFVAVTGGRSEDDATRCIGRGGHGQFAHAAIVPGFDGPSFTLAA